MRPLRSDAETNAVSSTTFPFASGLFENQIVVVTGGGTGIGLSTARRLAALGAKVAIGSRKQPNIDAGLEALAEVAPRDRLFGHPLDTREPPQAEAFVDAVLAKWGRIDVLVNNAGGQFPAPAQHISPRGWEAVVRNNLNGTFFMTQVVANKAMLPQKRGRIVNVIAQMWRGFPGMAHTGAARAGVDNLTKTLAVEWAPHGIRVNAVAPGVIKSSGTDQYPPEILERALRACPLKRGGTPDEVARVIVTLASDQFDFVTGETWYVDGGAKLWGDTWDVPDSV